MIQFYIRNSIPGIYYESNSTYARVFIYANPIHAVFLNRCTVFIVRRSLYTIPSYALTKYGTTFIGCKVRPGMYTTQKASYNLSS